MDIGFCGNSLSLILSDVWWDVIGQRGTWHETNGGYLWILVGVAPGSGGFCDDVAD